MLARSLTLVALNKHLKCTETSKKLYLAETLRQSQGGHNATVTPENKNFVIAT